MADDITTIVAAAFENENDARQALDALRQAGFGYDQVGVAPQGQHDIKLKDDLEALGVPDDVATYYDEQYKNGRTVVSVRPDGQDEQVHNLLHHYNGYDYEHQSGYNQTSSNATTTATQPNGPIDQNKYDVSGNYPPDSATTQSQSNATSTQANLSSGDVTAVNTAASRNYTQDEYNQPRSLRPRIGTVVSPDNTQTTVPDQSSDTVTE